MKGRGKEPGFPALIPSEGVWEVWWGVGGGGVKERSVVTAMEYFPKVSLTHHHLFLVFRRAFC